MFYTHFLWLLSWLLTNWGSLSVLPRFPSVSEMHWWFTVLGPNTASIILNHFQPHLHIAPGTITTGGHRRKVLPLQIPVLLFSRPDSGNQALCCAGRMVCNPLFWRGKTIVLTVLCFGWVQFNPRFPVALTKKRPLQTQIALADLSKRPRGGWAMTAGATPRSNPIPWAKSKIKRWRGT